MPVMRVHSELLGECSVATAGVFGMTEVLLVLKSHGKVAEQQWVGGPFFDGRSHKVRGLVITKGTN